MEWGGIFIVWLGRDVHCLACHSVWRNDHCLKYKYFCVYPQCVYEDKTRAGGVTSMRMSGNRVMVARLSGVVDMLLLEAVTTVTTPASTPTTAPTTSPLHHQYGDSPSVYTVQQNHQYPRRPGMCS